MQESLIITTNTFRATRSGLTSQLATIPESSLGTTVHQNSGY